METTNERTAANLRGRDVEDTTDRAARVLVASNGSPQSRDALLLGAIVARSTGAHLVVACIFPPDSLAGMTFEPRAARVASEDHRIFVRQDADAVLAEARAALPDELAVDYRALECQSLRSGLRQLVVSDAIDLLVLGSSHRGQAEQLLPVGVTRRLLRHPPCALAVAPRDFRYRKDPVLRELVVAHDQSPASERALDVAAAFAIQLSARSRTVTNLRVFQVAARDRPGRSSAEDELAARADIDARVATRVGFARDVDRGSRDAPLQIYTRATVARDNATGDLIDITTSEADCLVLDWPRRTRRRGRRLLRRARLLRRSGCPLLLVPAGVRSPFLVSLESAEPVRRDGRVGNVTTARRRRPRASSLRPGGRERSPAEMTSASAMATNSSRSAPPRSLDSASGTTVAPASDTA
jgi:nucleotide-binding universal stress UspA family protein